MKRSPQNKEDLKDLAAKLDEQRNIIDAIDADILQLIDRRLLAAQEIGRIKKRQHARVLDNQRELRIFQKLFGLSEHTRLSKTALYKIFSAIISASRVIQKPASEASADPREAEIYAVLGHPVAHSLSPVMHSAAFSATGYDGVYLAVNVPDIGVALSGLKALNFKGASITIPHKIAVMEFIDEIDAQAEKIQAVNTVKNNDGRLFGCNTDCFGAISALSEKTVIKDKEVTMLGAGGAARAIGFGIRAAGGRLTIVNRSPQKGSQLAGDLDADFRPLAEVNKLDCHILINATSVGMFPDNDHVPLPQKFLDKKMVVMDIVYNPLKTKLLKWAETIGCATVDGVSMFVHQGAKQFEFWTGRKAPVEIMKMTVLAALEERG